MPASSVRKRRGATFTAVSGSLEFLKRSPETATVEDIRRFQLHLSETGISTCSHNRFMTGVRFLFRVTLRLRRLDLRQPHNRHRDFRALLRAEVSPTPPAAIRIDT